MRIIPGGIEKVDGREEGGLGSLVSVCLVAGPLRCFQRASDVTPNTYYDSAKGSETFDSLLPIFLLVTFFH